MSVLVISIHVVVVVLPIPCTTIIGRVDVNAVHFSCVQVFQQLEGMVVVCLDQGMPKVAVRRVAHRIQWLKIGIDGFSELCYRDQSVHRQGDPRLIGLPQADGLPIGDGFHIEKIGDLAALLRDNGALLHGNVVKGGGFRNVLFIDEPETLLLVGPFQLRTNALAQ